MDSLLNLRSLLLASRVSNHYGYLSNSVKTIFIPVNIIYCTTTMANLNEDSLHAPNPNYYSTHIYIYIHIYIYVYIYIYGRYVHGLYMYMDVLVYIYKVQKLDNSGIDFEV